jgi:hypothetical protein
MRRGSLFGRGGKLRGEKIVRWARSQPGGGHRRQEKKTEELRDTRMAQR